MTNKGLGEMKVLDKASEERLKNLENIKESKEHIVPAGFLDDQESFVFDNQVVIDKKLYSSFPVFIV